jgi:hypothetical protein
MMVSIGYGGVGKTREIRSYIPPCASSRMSAWLSKKLPFMVRTSCLPCCDVNVAVALLPSTISRESVIVPTIVFFCNIPQIDAKKWQTYA